MSRCSSKEPCRAPTKRTREVSCCHDDLMVRLTDLEDTGRLQYFFHCPDSPLPIRDVVYKKKTEPHIEIGAENWCSSCLPKNIREFLKGPEKYLFLFTRCASGLHEGKYFVVGFIEKQDCQPMCGEKETWYAVRGPTKVFSFNDGYPMPGVRNARHLACCLNAAETASILKHFEDRRNILKDCIEEILRRDPAAHTCCVRNCSHRETDCLRYRQGAS